MVAYSHLLPCPSSSHSLRYLSISWPLFLPLHRRSSLATPPIPILRLVLRGRWRSRKQIPELPWICVLTDQMGLPTVYLSLPYHLLSVFRLFLILKRPRRSVLKSKGAEPQIKLLPLSRFSPFLSVVADPSPLLFPAAFSHQVRK